MNNNFLKKIYYEMQRIRLIELKIAEKYKEWKMRCPVHLSIGQESSPVGICQNLNLRDEVVTAHRSHAHYLAKGGSLKKMIAELYGKITGCAKGLGGSMHLIDIEKGITAAVPIVGSTIPIGVGKAWANKLKNNKNIVVIFFGDGATEEGVFLESLDFAALKDLRVLFVCENNKFSVYSDIQKRQSVKRNISKIAEASGIKSLKIKTHNIIDIYNKSKKIIKNIRQKSKPFFIEINTYRNYEHCGPNIDNYLNYRPQYEINYWNSKDQIIYCEKILKKKNILDIYKITKIKKRINEEINLAFDYAEKSKYPKKSLLLKYIYS
jgi:TPP-dependent pyruvate/acetoin dehydrogenase alpha subunit